MIQVCPKRDTICPHGLSCPFAIDRYECKPEPAATHPTPNPQPPQPLATSSRSMNPARPD